MRWIALLLVMLTAQPLYAEQAPADFVGLIDAHNGARRALGIAPLGWSTGLAAEAQQWADQLTTEDCALRYDPDPTRRETTGQNLFRAHSNAPYAGYKRSAAEAADRWVREGARYDHAAHQCTPGLGSQCGAYLQVIWQATTALGCGRARCATAEVWVCHYTPRGGQNDLKPYGNAPPSSPVAELPRVQQCSAPEPTAATQFSEALTEKLAQ